MGTWPVQASRGPLCTSANRDRLLRRGRGPSPDPPHLARLGACDSALAAADFSALVDFGLLNTFAAALAAFFPVWRVFRAM